MFFFCWFLWQASASTQRMTQRDRRRADSIPLRQSAPRIDGRSSCSGTSVSRVGGKVGLQKGRWRYSIWDMHPKHPELVQNILRVITSLIII